MTDAVKTESATLLEAEASLPKIDLYCTTGGASKEYHLFTVANPEGDFTLFYANGKIGDAMKPKIKTGPGPLEVIRKSFDKTVKEKKGASPPYTEASSGVTYSTSSDAGDQSGWLPQLLNEVLDDGLEALLRDPHWIAQEKKNGQRRGVIVKDGAVRGVNKKGRFIGGVPQPWVHALKERLADSIIDGEHVGAKLFVFDSPRIAGEDLTQRRYAYRLERVREHLANLNEPMIEVLDSEHTEAGKRALLERIRQENGEGIVFRNVGGIYLSGAAKNLRSADSIKYKLYEYSNCLVTAKNTGRSVALGLLDSIGAVVPVGSVTIPANQDIPSPGAVLKVRYMHMFEGGKLYGPPVSYGVAAGVKSETCTLDQVKRIVSKALDVDNEEDGDEDSPAAEQLARPNSDRDRPRG